MNFGFFPHYIQDSRQFFQTTNRMYDNSFEAEPESLNEYNFLPSAKPNIFDSFDPTSFNPNSLNISRVTTDTTDTSEYLTNSRIGLSPTFPTNFKKNPVADLTYNITANFAPKEILLQNPKNRFSTVIGSSNGISFNLMKPVEQPKQEIQSHNTTFNNKAEMNQVKDEEVDEEAPLVQEAVVNTQLKGLREAKIWNEEKDQLLLKLGTQYKCDWKKIARRFAHKKITPHFLKIRYKELTCAPLQRRIKFNHKEDLMISKYFEKYGSNWAQMATHFRERTPIMLKNRYYSFIRKRDLLEFLLEEVKEMEKDGIAVEDRQDMDPELYTDPYAGKNSKNDSGNSCDEDNYVEEQEDVKQQQRQHHPIFSYEASTSEFPHSTSYKEDEEEKIFEDTEGSDRSIDQSSELLHWKSRFNTMESLYLKTKAELDQFKGTVKQHF